MLVVKTETQRGERARIEHFTSEITSETLAMLAGARGSVKSAIAPSFPISAPYHTPSLALCAHVSVCVLGN